MCVYEEIQCLRSGVGVVECAKKGDVQISLISLSTLSSSSENYQDKTAVPVRRPHLHCLTLDTTRQVQGSRHWHISKLLGCYTAIPSDQRSKCAKPRTPLGHTKAHCPGRLVAIGVDSASLFYICCTSVGLIRCRLRSSTASQHQIEVKSTSCGYLRGVARSV